jgi:hypothetical protein
MMSHIKHAVRKLTFLILTGSEGRSAYRPTFQIFTGLMQTFLILAAVLPANAFVYHAVDSSEME